MAAGDVPSPVSPAAKTYDTFDKPASASAGSATNGAAALPNEEHRQVTMRDAFGTVKGEDFTKVHTYPCARDAFMTGIGAGFTAGGLRAIMGAPVMRSANWAVGACLLGAIGSYEYCMHKRSKEKELIRRAVEIMDQKKVEKEQKIAAARRRMEEAKAAKQAEEQKSSWKFW